MGAQVTTELVIDLVCPWCWLGLRHWKRAQALTGEIDTPTWLRPHQLDPSLPPEGAPYRAYMAQKFAGSARERWRAMREHLEAAAPEAGIVFRFEAIERRPNTLNAHRLIRWAQGQGLGEAAAERLFKAFLDERQDIGDLSVLADLAGEIGLDRDLVAELLAADRDAAAVLQDEAVFRAMGVSGVPAFVLNREYLVSGAEPPEVLALAIRRAAGVERADRAVTP